MTLFDYNDKIVGSHNTERIWKVCLDDFLSKFTGEEFVILFINYKVVKPLPRYECIVGGIVMTISRGNVWNRLEVLKCKWVCWWVLS